jgi:phenylacetate 2-hydroxylase
MTSPIIGAAVLFVLFVLWKWTNSTDQPKIAGIPEIPGWPIVGSLYELGEVHARVAQKWAKKYGPVFQARLGNKVCSWCIVFNNGGN